MSKDRKFPKCGNRKHPPITIQTQKKKYYEKIYTYSKKESDLRTPRDPIKETTQNSLKIFYSILFLCETRKRLQSGFRVFISPLDLTKKEKHPPPKKKETKKKKKKKTLFLRSLLSRFVFSLALSLSLSLSPSLSLIHAERTGVGDTQPEPLTLLRTNQTVPTTTLHQKQPNKESREREREW